MYVSAGRNPATTSAVSVDTVRRRPMLVFAQCHNTRVSGEREEVEVTTVHHVDAA